MKILSTEASAASSGALWGLDTVVLAIAPAMIPFADFGPVAGAVLHDVVCRHPGRVYGSWPLSRTPGRRCAPVSRSSQRLPPLGGPIGMSGYLIAIDNTARD